MLTSAKTLKPSPSLTPSSPTWEAKKVWGITQLVWLWALNVAGCVAHSGFAFASVWASTRKGGMDTPQLTVSLTKLEWEQDSSDPISTVVVPASPPLYLSWVVLSFFLLSALAHGVIAIGNVPGSDRVVCGVKSGWYYTWISESRQPLRWVEYSFSASVMILAIAAASGVTQVYMLVFIFALMFVTMVFGWVTEELSRPDGDKWQKSRRVRLIPHFLGYVPYLAVWGVLLHSFHSNTSEEMPDFVYVIVYGQLVLFSLFGVTQLLNQLDDNGPTGYPQGEASYLALSLVSKGVLGSTLIVSVLMYDSFEEAVQKA